MKPNSVMPGRRLRTRRGAVVLVVAASLFSVSAFGLFVLDTGQIYRQRRHAQTAADAGALAGANEAFRGQWGLITSSAQDGSTSNGYVNGAGNVTVTVHNPPVSGYYIGDVRFVEVVVERRLPTIGLRMFGIDTVGIRARAVAGAAGNAVNCIHTLDPAMSQALYMLSSTQLDANCGVMVNSRHSGALYMESSSSIDAGVIGVTGNYVNLVGPGALNPTPTTGIPPAPDPLGSLESPTVGACTVTNFRRSSGSVTINPGVYCGSILLENDASVVLNPGVYILCGPSDGSIYGLQLKGNSRITGTEVMIYLTACGTTWPFRPIKVESNAQINLSAPTSGSYAGIVFYQDRTIPIGTGSSGAWPDASGGFQHTFESSSSATITGTMYFPTHMVRIMSSVVISGAYTSVISRALRMESSAQLILNEDFSSLTGGNPIKRLTLVE
jgi:hypothetical protein